MHLSNNLASRRQRTAGLLRDPIALVLIVYSITRAMYLGGEGNRRGGAESGGALPGD